MTRLTARHEGARAAPWHVGDAPADYIETMLGAIEHLKAMVAPKAAAAGAPGKGRRKAPKNL